VLTGRDGTVNWQVARVAVVASAEPVHNARSVIRADGLEQCATSARVAPGDNAADHRGRGMASARRGPSFGRAPARLVWSAKLLQIESCSCQGPIAGARESDGWRGGVALGSGPGVA
jgi:hypothetical protein